MVTSTAALTGLLAGLSVARLLAGADVSTGRFAPSYASSTVVHAASQITGAFAPNTIITIYGKDLSYTTNAIGGADVRGGSLPTTLSGTGVHVHLDGIPAPLYFVSPTQVNLLIPATLRPGVRRLQLVQDGRAGPAVELLVSAAAPGLFLAQPGWALAVRLDGSVVTAAQPARRGETLVLFATGLGETEGARPAAGEIARGAAWVVARDSVRLILNGTPLARDQIYYAGLSPGFAGLYQINLRLPEAAEADPEIRVAIGDAASPGGVRLPLSGEGK